MPFVMYEFDEREQALASVFTDLQFKNVQTKLAIVAVEKSQLALRPDENNPEALFINENEYMRGRMEALQELLNEHNETVTALQDAMTAEAANPISKKVED
jgi:hypothetical protein